jgi:hypothetical protein
VKNLQILFMGCVVIFLFVISSGCANIPQEEAAKELVPIKSIGVLPAQPARITILPSDTQTRQQREAGSTIINSLLSDYFRDYRDVRFISQTELEGLQPTQPGQALYLAREAGQQLHYDAVLVTEVERYQTRTGSAYAVDTPASVTFSLKLLAIASGQIIWSADFDQTQPRINAKVWNSLQSLVHAQHKRRGMVSRG